MDKSDTVEVTIRTENSSRLIMVKKEELKPLMNVIGAFDVSNKEGSRDYSKQVKVSGSSERRL